MFFKKFFGKDCGWYKEKGDEYLADGRFADARHAYEDAMERLPDGPAGDELRTTLRARMAEAGNGLAEMNIAEARLYLNQDNPEKACEYLELALKLAEDGGVREKAEKLMKGVAPSKVVFHEKKEHGHHGCSSCHSTSCHDLPADTEDSLSVEDRFHIIIQALPGDLPNRYAMMGEKFAYGYLALNQEDLDTAYQVFAELAAAKPKDDILLYELGALSFRKGSIPESERLFRASKAANGQNPLTRLGLTQLLIYSKRLDEAMAELEMMVEGDILANEAQVMIGDVLVLKGDEGVAIDHFAKLLENKPYQKIAAERLVPLLTQQGRETEAEFLTKQYLKGCC